MSKTGPRINITEDEINTSRQLRLFLRPYETAKQTGRRLCQGSGIDTGTPQRDCSQCSYEAVGKRSEEGRILSGDGFVGNARRQYRRVLFESQ